MVFALNGNTQRFKRSLRPSRSSSFLLYPPKRRRLPRTWSERNWAAPHWRIKWGKYRYWPRSLIQFGLWYLFEHEIDELFINLLNPKRQVGSRLQKFEKAHGGKRKKRKLRKGTSWAERGLLKHAHHARERSVNLQNVWFRIVGRRPTCIYSEKRSIRHYIASIQYS